VPENRAILTEGASLKWGWEACGKIATVPGKIRPPTRKATAAKLRAWRVSIIRKRAQYLGTVDAQDEKTAEAAAVAEFNLTDEQRKRLVLQRASSAKATYSLATKGPTGPTPTR
jgi:hypothetical protein